jgi:sugar lactone lactonase YvrE
MLELEADCIYEAGATLGEGACWDDRTNTLIWVDIENCQVNSLNPTDGNNESWTLDSHTGFAIPAADDDLIVGTQQGIVRLNRKSGKIVKVVDPEEDLERNRFNDGKCDPQGRLWAGTINYDREPGAASLYRLRQGTEIEKVVGNITNSNGLTWSPDKRTFYYIDTPTRQVDAFDYLDSSGEISNRRTIFKVPETMGKPDGMTVDSEGMLWVALWGGWGVSKWNPSTGELLGKISMPVERVTTCCFGGPNLDDLYITCARSGLTETALEEQPLAGGIFKASLQVGGLPSNRYQG